MSQARTCWDQLGIKLGISCRMFVEVRPFFFFYETIHNRNGLSYTELVALVLPWALYPLTVAQPGGGESCKISPPSWPPLYQRFQYSYAISKICGAPGDPAFILFSTNILKKIYNCFYHSGSFPYAGL